MNIMETKYMHAWISIEQGDEPRIGQFNAATGEFVKWINKKDLRYELYAAEADTMLTTIIPSRNKGVRSGTNSNG